LRTLLQVVAIAVVLCLGTSMALAQETGKSGSPKGETKKKTEKVEKETGKRVPPPGKRPKAGKRQTEERGSPQKGRGAKVGKTGKGRIGKGKSQGKNGKGRVGNGGPLGKNGKGRCKDCMRKKRSQGQPKGRGQNVRRDKQSRITRGNTGIEKRKARGGAIGRGSDEQKSPRRSRITRQRDASDSGPAKSNKTRRVEPQRKTKTDQRDAVGAKTRTIKS